MNEKAVSVFDQYELEVENIFKLRGNYGCNTTSGKYLLLEYDFSEEKLETLFTVQDYLERGGVKTEKLIHNKDARLISVGEDGFGYVLKKIYDVEECDIRKREHIKSATRTLAEIHNRCESMEGIWGNEVRIYLGKNMLLAYGKHNKEMINIRNYIVKKKNKNFFERYLQNIIEVYYQQGKSTMELLEKSKYSEMYEEACRKKQLLHGNYNHHAVAFEKERPVLVNLCKVYYGPRIHDLYDFMRKVLEKNNWNIELGHEILTSYQNIVSFKEEESVILKALFSYPEKFWKIVNYYYNSNKAWYSEKNEEKLKAFQEQEGLRWKFIESL